MTSDVENLFMYLLAFCISSLENIYLGPLLIFILFSSFSLLWSCMNSLYIFDTNPRSDVSFCSVQFSCSVVSDSL